MSKFKLESYYINPTCVFNNGELAKSYYEFIKNYEKKSNGNAANFIFLCDLNKKTEFSQSDDIFKRIDKLYVNDQIRIETDTNIKKYINHCIELENEMDTSEIASILRNIVSVIKKKLTGDLLSLFIRDKKTSKIFEK